ncbi:MAG TPA: hypothetical protein VH044_08955, partial [Polyangiaceae bacterium]|nr:hypothetical protein [Polyangiaceae bacterium]
MTELLVGSRLPDLSQVIVDVVLRYRMKRGGKGPITVDGLRRGAARFERANERMPTPPFVKVEPVQVGGIAAEWISIKEQPANGQVVLYFHGGG